MTENELSLLVVNIGYCLLLARTILLFSFLVKPFTYLKNRYTKPLFWYALIATLIAFLELLVIYLANLKPSPIIPLLQKLGIENTFFTSPLYYINEIIFITAYFSRLLNKEIIFKIGLIISGFEILNTLFFEGYNDGQPYGSIIYIIFEIILGYWFIRNCYLNNRKKNLLKDTYFIISLSIIIPYSITIFFYFISKYLFQDDTILYFKLSIIRMMIEIIGLLGIAYSVLKFKEKTIKLYT